MNWCEVISRIAGVKNDYSMVIFMWQIGEIKIDDSLERDFCYLFANTFEAKGNKGRLNKN